MSNFDTLFEKELERFQQGGIIVGDRVRFKKDALKLDYIASRARSYQEIIKACMEPSFDLNLRVGAVKSIYPTSATNFQAGNAAPDGVFLDIYIEYAPGLFRNPMTVPFEAVDVIDDGNERGPIPDSFRRKNKIHGPEEVKAETDNTESNINLTNKNVQLPGANKWDDTQPGGGNFKPKR
jgi:hypothetical protein